MTHKIILTRGIQGSGKSTWAKAWVEESPLNRCRYNSDDMRMMFGPYDVKNWDKKDKILNKVFVEFMNACMQKGYDIVVDNMNLSDSAVERVKNIVGAWNAEHSEDMYEIEFKDFFDITVAECIRRDAMRPNPIGEKVIRQTWKRYKNLVMSVQIKKQVDALTEYEAKHNSELPDCVVADMDATLCWNVTGRPFYGAGAAEGMSMDRPNDGVIRLCTDFLNSCKDDDRLFIVTGREGTKNIKEATENWLKMFFPEECMSKIVVLYRQISDFTPGDKAKVKMLEDHVFGKYNIRYAIDDSKKVVDAYRKLGLTVLMPNEGCD